MIQDDRLAAFDRRLLYMLQRASRAAMARANADSREHLGASIEQLATLSYVAKHPGCAMTDVAGVLDLNKSAMSAMVSRLEQRGLIGRALNPRDGRGFCLSLTAEGETKLAEARPIFRRTMSAMTEGFSEQEIALVLRFLNTLASRFSREVGEYE